jgi:predicted nucleic acid-binding protein
LAHLRRSLVAAGVGADMVTDAHLASIAMEYQAELHSNDVDFSRFPGLRWRNPL